MSEQTPGGLPQDAQSIAEHSGWFYTFGAIFIIVGILAILVPLAATIAAELLVGVALVILGVIELVRAFRMRGLGSIAGTALLGVLALVVGLIMLAFPLDGALTLTVFLIAFFLAEGVVKCFMSYEMRERRGWGWTLFSGIASIIVGILLWVALPGSALWALGLLLGIDFLIFGWTLIAITLAATRAQ